MKRLLLSTLLTMVTALAVALPAEAGLEWCPRDPIVRLNGTTVQILVAIPQQYVEHVTGPTVVEITTPKGTNRELLFTDDGFGGHGESVIFSDSSSPRGQERAGRRSIRSLPVEIRVQVPVDESRLTPGETIPVMMTVLPEHGGQMVVCGDNRGTRAEVVIRHSKRGK